MTDQAASPQPESPAPQSAPGVSEPISEKGFVPTILLCFFLGGFGIHRFYAGKAGTGILMLLTFGGLGIWTLIDFILIACSKFTDGNGAVIKPA